MIPSALKKNLVAAILWLVSPIVGLSSPPASSSAKQVKTKYTVHINQIVEHPSLDAISAGAQKELTDLLPGELEFRYANAQGNAAVNVQIAKNSLAKRPDVILAIGTGAAQAALQKNRRTPVIYAPISDPVAAKLAKTWDSPGGLGSGVSDQSPIEAQLRLIQSIHSKAKNIGFIYNPGEMNSHVSSERFTATCKKLKLTATLAPVQSTNMVFAAAKALKGRGVDAIYVPTDNTVVSAVEAVIKAGIASKIPVFTAETESVRKGAIASLGFDYHELGKAAGQMIKKILKDGAKPATMPIHRQEKTVLLVNPLNAEKMGISLDQAHLKSLGATIL